MNLDLDRLRARIDGVDDAIVDLLAERSALVAEAWEQKARAGVAARDAPREAILRARWRTRAEKRGLDPDAVERVCEAVIGRNLQRGKPA